MIFSDYWVGVGHMVIPKEENMVQYVDLLVVYNKAVVVVLVVQCKQRQGKKSSSCSRLFWFCLIKIIELLQGVHKKVPRSFCLISLATNRLVV